MKSLFFTWCFISDVQKTLFLKWFFIPKSMSINGNRALIRALHVSGGLIFKSSKIHENLRCKRNPAPTTPEDWGNATPWCNEISASFLGALQLQHGAMQGTKWRPSDPATPGTLHIVLIGYIINANELPQWGSQMSSQICQARRALPK